MSCDFPVPTRLVERFCTGHPAIDSDHRRLARALARGLDGLNGGVLHEGVTQALGGMVVQALAHHLRREEDILRECGYPRLDNHAAHHADLLRRAELLGEACEAADRKGLRDCFEQLTALFVEEVVGGDHAFISWLEEQGAAVPVRSPHRP